MQNILCMASRDDLHVVTPADHQYSTASTATTSSTGLLQQKLLASSICTSLSSGFFINSWPDQFVQDAQYTAATSHLNIGPYDVLSNADQDMILVDHLHYLKTYDHCRPENSTVLSSACYTHEKEPNLRDVCPHYRDALGEDVSTGADEPNIGSLLSSHVYGAASCLLNADHHDDFAEQLDGSFFSNSIHHATSSKDHDLYDLSELAINKLDSPQPGVSVSRVRSSTSCFENAVHDRQQPIHPLHEIVNGRNNGASTDQTHDRSAAGQHQQGAEPLQYGEDTTSTAILIPPNADPILSTLDDGCKICISCTDDKQELDDVLDNLLQQVEEYSVSAAAASPSAVVAASSCVPPRKILDFSTSTHYDSGTDRLCNALLSGISNKRPSDEVVDGHRAPAMSVKRLCNNTTVGSTTGNETTANSCIRCTELADQFNISPVNYTIRSRCSTTIRPIEGQSAGEDTSRASSIWNQDPAALQLSIGQIGRSAILRWAQQHLDGPDEIQDLVNPAGRAYRSAAAREVELALNSVGAAQIRQQYSSEDMMKYISTVRTANILGWQHAAQKGAVDSGNNACTPTSSTQEGLADQTAGGRTNISEGDNDADDEPNIISTQLQERIIRRPSTTLVHNCIGPTLRDVQIALAQNDSVMQMMMNKQDAAAGRCCMDDPARPRGVVPILHHQFIVIDTPNSISNTSSSCAECDVDVVVNAGDGRQAAAAALVSGSTDATKASFLTDEVALLCKEDVEQASHPLVESWRARLQKRTSISGSGSRSSYSSCAGPCKYSVKVSSEEEAARDGYRWRKYGQKSIKNSPFPRCYYKCSTRDCQVKKQVERCTEPSKSFLVTYEGLHAHRKPDVCHVCASSSISLLNM